MKNCPIRALAQQASGGFYRDIQKKEIEIREKRYTATKEELNKILHEIQYLWTNLSTMMKTQGFLIRTNNQNNGSLIWSNLLGSTYEPHELQNIVKEKMDKIDIYFAFWEGLERESGEYEE